MTAAASIEIAIDAEDPEGAASFWAQALRYEPIARRDQYIVLGPPAGDPRPRVVIQGVDSVAPGKARLHLDLRVPHPAAEVERLTKLGASVLREVDETALGGNRWTVMVAPLGTVFCVCPAREE
jgi:hypothetical protein